MKYKLIKQDTFKKLQLGKIYTIIDNFLVADHDYSIKLYYIDSWQLKNMFEKIN